MIEQNDHTEDGAASGRVEELLQFQHLQVFQATDRLFVALILLQWIGGIAIALFVSPNKWIGTTPEVHLHVWAAVLLGGAISSLPVFLGLKYPGRPMTRYVIAIAQMLWSSLLIHFTGGRIETHFHIFVSLAFLSFYCEWRLLVVAAIVTAADHAIRGILWPQSVYGVLVESPFRWIEHVGWVLFEVGVLASGCRRSQRGIRLNVECQAQLELVNRRFELRVQERTWELKLNELKLRLSESRLQAMLRSTLDPMITIDSHGIVHAASDSSEKVLGWKSDELIGQNIKILISEPHGSEHDGYLSRYRRTGMSTLLGHPLEVTAVRRDGTVFPCLTKFWKVDMPDGLETLFMGTIHDITEQKQNAKFVADRMRSQSLSVSIATALMQGGSLQKVLQRSAELLAGQLDVAFARIWTYNKSDQMFELQASAGFSTQIDGAHSRVPLGMFMIGSIAAQQRSLVTNDVQNDSRVSDSLRAQLDGMVAFAAHSLITGGELAGVMTVCSQHPFTQSVIDALASTADSLSLGIGRIRAEGRLAKFRAALDCSPDAVFLFDRLSMKFIDMNKTACDSTGYSREELLTMGPHCINPQIAKEDLERQIDAVIESKHHVKAMETIHRGKDGSTYPVEISMRHFTRDDRTILVSAVRDITERQQLIQQLHALAFHDVLTGLPNRGSILSSIQDAIHRNDDDHFALLFMDFDGFKLINDSLGHEAGDALLKEIACRLQNNFREMDRMQAARLGGDEFVVLLEGLDRPADAIKVAERLLHVLSKSYKLGSNLIYSTASIGIVTNECRYQSASDMLRDADLAMYEAKSSGKARFVCFDRSQREKVQSRLSIENDLRDALSKDEFVLAYQPIVSLETGRMAGVEVLLRWIHPKRGLVGPDTFISVAEETGMIVSIGSWVIDEACRQFAEWQNALPAADRPPCVHVNVSRIQLMSANLVKVVDESLARHAVPPECLHLEVTESVIMNDPKFTITVLNNLRQLGVKIDMDDFGTGYSSLSCLHEFPIDVLKIDRTFVANVTRVRDFSALLHAVLTLADNLNLQVVAEGIEHLDQLATLQALGCGYGQGYLFAKPMPADEVGRFAASRRKTNSSEVNVLSSCQ